MEMEGNVKGSFLERSTWQGLLKAVEKKGVCCVAIPEIRFPRHLP